MKESKKPLVYFMRCCARQGMGAIPYCLTVVIAVICLACAGKKHQALPEPMPVPDPPVLSDTRKIIIHTATKSLGTPYRWGGHTPGQGFDCSGLVFYAYQRAGIHVPRTARQQFRQGKRIHRHQLLPGDLIFFTILDKKTNLHVGIYAGDNRFIHAPGRGRSVTNADLNAPYFRQTYAGARSFH
jgi:cell wall-associated NlpC family hydrolase